MTRVYWDSMLFAYLIEGNDEFGVRTRTIYEEMQEREHVLCTSILTLGEVLTGPLKREALDVVAHIRELLRPPLVEIIPFDTSVAERYAEIRARRKVAPADAIHLASAAQFGVSLLLTNDHRLTKMSMPGIDFIAGLDVNLF